MVMKKTIYLFIGGSLFGAIAAFAIVNLATNNGQISPIAKAKNNVKIQTVKLPKSSGEPSESMSDMQVRLSQQPGMDGMVDMQNVPQDSMQNDSAAENAVDEGKAEAQTVQPQTTQKAPTAVAAIPPTTEQIQQYNDIDKIISTAANNPKIKLHDIIRKSNNLTIQQRNQLTQKTIDMLSRGELSIDQFSDRQPGS